VDLQNAMGQDGRSHSLEAAWNLENHAVEALEAMGAEIHDRV